MVISKTCSKIYLTCSCVGFLSFHWIMHQFLFEKINEEWQALASLFAVITLSAFSLHQETTLCYWQPPCFHPYVSSAALRSPFLMEFQVLSIFAEMSENFIFDVFLYWNCSLIAGSLSFCFPSWKYPDGPVSLCSQNWIINKWLVLWCSLHSQ